MHTFKNRWTIGGSFEFPKSSPDVIDGQTKKCADYVPDVAAMAQYQWDEGLSHLRLSGLLRVMSYRDLISNRNRNVVGWGAMVSGMWKVFKPLTLYGSVSVGQGMLLIRESLPPGISTLWATSTIPENFMHRHLLALLQV